MFNSSIDNNENELSLIDNGSEIEIVNESFAREKKLQLISLKRRDQVNLILGDGTRSQILKKAVIINLDIGSQKEELKCYVGKIEDCTLLLGDGWLQKHNPKINWEKRTMKFSKRCLELGCIDRRISIMANEYEKDGKPAPRGFANPATDFKGVEPLKSRKKDIKRITPKRFMKLMGESDHQVYCLYPREKFERKLERYHKKMLAAATVGAIEQSDHDKFMKVKPEYSIEELKQRVPVAYHDEIEVFSQKKADELPPHRKEDHEIILKPGTEPPFITSYRPMSEQELAAAKKYLDEHLEKGFIRPSSSKAAAPVLFVKKPNGGLRFCIDYRKLNEITEKNRYPIPLINETLTRLSKASVFTKLDVIAAFNKIRIKEGQEWMTAFNTRYGQFEYLVLPFGLCNAPSTFQSYINESLREFLDHYVTAYIDDVLVYSKKSEEHEAQVLQVLKRLKERGLHLDIDKCEFSVPEVKYLGMFVGRNGVRMDHSKVQTILEWRTPESVKDLQSFLGFANFYRRFIADFSKEVKCLTELTKGEQYVTSGGKKKTKYQAFIWSPECQSAFEELKKAFTEAPILAHYDPSLETWVETDSSDFVVAGVLSQMHDGILKPVAYFSRKMNPAECNYMIYDKELLAIINSFENWRPELTGAHDEVKVLSDHQNLEYFMKTKELNRQVRWAELLSELNFRIKFRPGKKGAKPDALTRRSQDLPKGTDDERNRYQEQVMLKTENLDEEIVKSLKANTVGLDAGELREDDGIEDDGKITPHGFDHSALEALLDESYSKDETVGEIIRAKKEGERKLSGKVMKSMGKIAMGDIIVRENRVYFKNRLWIPDSEIVQLHLLRAHHDPPMQGHPGYHGMYAKLKENYYWAGMKEACKKYASNCSVCRRAKAFNTQKQGLLAPLPVPQRKWADLSMDFVVKLPKCRRKIESMKTSW